MLWIKAWSWKGHHPPQWEGVLLQKKSDQRTKELPSMQVLSIQESKKVLVETSVLWVFNTQTQYKLTHTTLETKFLLPQKSVKLKFKKLTKTNKQTKKRIVLSRWSPWNYCQSKRNHIEELFTKCFPGGREKSKSL